MVHFRVSARRQHDELLCLFAAAGARACRVSGEEQYESIVRQE